MWTLQANISPYLCCAWDHPAWTIKESEMLLLLLGLEIPR